ncbi:MAG TPA: hypothetical protein PK156_48225 [Polyangium sp.]|nr:hypothetical protein [Polyangium sp.]
MGPVETRIHELVASDAGETVFAVRFFPLVELDSGSRVGLDAQARFAIAMADALHVFTPDDGHLFHEVLEWNRNKFEDALESGAKALGLPPLDVSFSFPAAGIVRAVLVKNMHYTTRLALQWLRPSELRDVQAELRRIVEDRATPTSLRDFASRLLVRE